MTRVVLAVLLAACSKGTASGTVDAPPKDTPGPDTPAPYRHTIQIDGIDDFQSGEQFPTTSAGYDARIAWDEQNIYVGYSGTDLDPASADTATKWLFIYIDADPGMPAGAMMNEGYNTQAATFPAGFLADFYARWKCDATLLSLKQFSGAAWTDAGVPPGMRGGNFVEIAIPRAMIGPSNTLHVVTWMINEKQNAEGTYAGLYAGNFLDGYHAALPLTKFLKIDFTAPRNPNDAANQGP